MLTIITTASLYNLSRNPNYVKISTNNYTFPDNIGDKAEGSFYKLAPNVLNNTFTIPFGGGTRTYTFKNALNIGSLELTKYVSGPVPIYLTNLVNELSTDVALTNLYYIQRVAASIVLIAKNPGTAYSLTGSSTTVSGASYYDTKPGTDVFVNKVRENFKIVTELYQETQANSNVFELVCIVPKEPSDNVVELDLADYIDNCLAYQFPEFYAPTQPPFFCPQLSKRFHVRNYESYGTPSVQQGAAFQTTDYFSLKAGFGPIMNKVLPVNQFANFYWAVNSFLTRQNRVKKISRGQNEFLYFLFASNYASRARLKYTLTDIFGNITTTNNSTTAANVNVGNVWCFQSNGPQGFFANDLNIIKMEVQVEIVSTQTVVSETFTYLADDEYYPEEHFLYFANSDGGMDTVRTTGVVQQDIDIVRETANRTLTINDGPYDGDTTSLYNNKTQSNTVFSGYKSKSEMDYFEDLFLSKKIFIYKTISANRIVEMPIVITSTKLTKHRTNQNLYGFVIEYKEARSSELPEISYHQY